MEAESVLQDLINKVIVREVTSYREHASFEAAREMVLALAPTKETATQFVAGATSYLKPSKTRQPKAIKGEHDVREYIADLTEQATVRVREIVALASGLVQGLLDATLSVPELYAQVVSQGLRR